MRIGLTREVTEIRSSQNLLRQIIYADKSGSRTSATNRVLAQNAESFERFSLCQGAIRTDTLTVICQVSIKRSVRKWQDRKSESN